MPLLLEWGKNTFFLCTCSRNCIIIIVSVVVVVMFQNCQVIASSLGCCWYSGPPPLPRILEFLQHLVEDGCSGMKGDSGIVTEDVCEDGM